MDITKRAQMIRVVELYYLQNMTQQEIANAVGISRPTVSRLLDDARNQDIVEIKLNIAEDVDVKLSNQIRKVLGIKEAIVVDTHETEEGIILEKTAHMAAEYLSGVVRENYVVGVSWGRAMNALANSIEPHKVENFKVVQLAGGLGGPDSKFDGSNVAYTLASKFGGSCYCIFGPAILPNANMVEELWQVPAVRETLELASRADVYITGIGTLNESSSLSRAGYLDEKGRKSLMEQGASAHLLARILRKDGSELTEFNYRVLSIALECLNGNNLSIGVAVTAKKAEAVCTVTKGGYLNVIIIDKSCAEAILKNS